MNGTRRVLGWVAAGTLAVGALAGCTSTPTQEEAEAAVCDDLADVRDAVEDVKALSTDSTVDEATAARDALADAVATLKESAADLETADTAALEAGADAISSAVDEVSGSDTLAGAASSVTAARSELESAIAEIDDGVGCS